MRFVSLKINKVHLAKGPWDVIEKEVAAHFSDRQAGAFVMMHHCAWLGIYRNGKFTTPISKPLDPTYLRFARIFDDESECYIWRNSDDPADIYRLRIRYDEEDKSEKPNVVEARQLLWGTRLEDSMEGRTLEGT